MLDAYRVLVSDDPEATRTFLSGKGLTVHPKASWRGGAPHAEISGLYADSFYIGWMSYGDGVRIDAPAERGDYGLSVPLAGAMAATGAGGELAACTTKRTVIGSPGSPQTTVVSGGTARLSLSVREDALRRRLSALVGEPVVGRVEFEPTLELGVGPGGLISQGMMLIAQQADRGVDVLGDPRRAAHFEDMALSALLLYQPHSHSALLAAPAASPAPQDVRRVIDFIEAHHDDPIRLEDLVATAGVPGRTLTTHFRAFTGLSPMGYLRRARLATARAALESGAAANVTDAALAAGFLHMSRFAAAYRTAFGEAPSETLARGRRARGV